MTHTVKNLSTMEEIRVCPLGQEEPLERKVNSLEKIPDAEKIESRRRR